ncbi:hypothetical protein SCHPADRAFT_198348 [Schizopora paradoxa]|uniref:Telomere-associated protein Rif1 N-terminal domain-containing protein n=1 Tax=Schizopora paradoxa TaxID=27342 RepID=A0A0H2RYB3_9AGAM|nr:hypothetical protein SCHPADRAFT_198348 [Schizopora paradoxa]
MGEDGVGNDEPLRNPHYFLGPLRTLRKSLSKQDDISTHDIADAYALLCSRIRGCGVALYAIGPASLSQYRALETLKQFKQPLFDAVKRDIQVANADDDDRSPDQATLGHSAVLFLSNLFKFRNLYFILSDDDIYDLLRSTMNFYDLPKARQKLTLLASWILSTQELPSRILSRCTDDIARFLKHGIRESNETTLKMLQTTQCLLKNSASIFLRSFVDNLLPLVLQHIVSENKRLHITSSEVTASFAHALFNMDSSVLDVKEKASAIVGRFIEKNISRHSSTSLEPLLHFSYTDSAGQLQPVPLSDSVRFVCTTVSLIMITGPQLFARSSSLKLLLNTLKRAKDAFKEHGFLHKKTYQKELGDPRNYKEEFTAMRRLLDAAWRSVVWTYSQFSSTTPLLAPRSGGRSRQKMDFKGMKESAFRIVEQEYGAGMAVLLIAHFLNTTADELTGERDIEKVLRILKKLLERSSWTAVGLTVFRRLVASLLHEPMHVAETWCDRNIVVKEIFDGTLCESERPEELCASISLIPLCAEPSDVVPPLNIEEVAGSRWEEIVTLWSDAVHERLRAGDRVLSSEIIDIWQALLFARTDLTQGNTHLTVSFERADLLSSILSSFVLASQEERPDVEHVQSLLVVCQLWRVVRNVFGKACLERMARDVLTCILMQIFNFEEEGVKDAWDAVCIELVRSGTPRVLSMNPDAPQTQQLTDSKKAVWKLATEQIMEVLISGESGADSELILGMSKGLLCVPIGQWDLTEDTHWDALLRSSTAFGSSEKSACTLLDRIAVAAKEMMDAGKNAIGVLHGLLLFLGESYSNGGFQGIPNVLLSIARDLLASSYPPTPTTVDDCQMLIFLLSNLLGRGCMTRRLALLSIVKDALVPWFADRDMILAEGCYNDILQFLYSEAINIILSNGSTQALVFEFADFLAAPFLRPDIPRPAVGPTSFKSFWETASQNIKFNNDDCPESIKFCLFRLQEFGHKLPAWLQEGSFESPSSVLQSPISYIVSPSVVSTPVSPAVPLSVLALRASPIAKRSPFSPVNERFNDLSPCPLRVTQLESPTSPAPMTLKRTSMLGSRPPKRRRVETNAEASSSKVDPRQSQTASKVDQNVPLTRAPRGSPMREAAPRKKRLLLDVIEVEPLRSSLKRKYKALNSDEYTGFAFTSPRIKSEDDSYMEEYSSWEVGLSSQDVTDAMEMASQEFR